LCDGSYRLLSVSISVLFTGEKLLLLVNEVHKDVLTRLKSILGIAKKTPLMLVVLTDGFDRFTSASELCSYAGQTPIIR